MPDGIRWIAYFVADDDGVAGIARSCIDDDVVRRQQVDDLALAFILLRPTAAVCLTIDIGITSVERSGPGMTGLRRSWQGGGVSGFQIVVQVFRHLVDDCGQVVEE